MPAMKSSLKATHSMKGNLKATHAMEIIFENRYRQKLNTIRKTTYAKKAVLQASAAHHKKKQLERTQMPWDLQKSDVC